MNARWLRSAVRLCLAGLAAWTGASGSALAALPEAGQPVRNAIDVRLLRKFPLPPGRWKVEVAFEESVQLTQATGRLEVPTQVLVLSNEERNADIAVLVLDFTSNARVNWEGQPCDTPPANVPLVTNTFGTTASSMQIRCNRVYAFDRFRQTVQQGGASSNAWTAKRFATLASRAAEMPVHAVLASAYAAAPRGDRVVISAYTNPAPHGLDGRPDARSPFRDIDKMGDRAASARAYLKALTEWIDAYSAIVQQRYLQGSGDSLEVPKFQFGSPSTQTAAAPPAVLPSVVPLPATAPPVQAAAPQQQPPAAQPAKPSAPAAAPGQTVHALVIGNSAYKGAALPNPTNDAKAIAQRFRAFGFEVTLLLDGTRKQMVESMSRFAESARTADVTIVFYAGHGLQLHGVNYLIPVDLDLGTTRALGLTYEAVALNALLEDHLPGKARLVFLDACRDNPLARSLSATRGSNRGLAAMNAATGTLISYATRDGSTAADGTGTNSPYTTALLAHIDEAEDISIVLRRVRQKVMDSTRGSQEPWEYGSLIGDKLVLSQLRGTR